MCYNEVTHIIPLIYGSLYSQDNDLLWVFVLQTLFLLEEDFYDLKRHHCSIIIP